MTAQQEFLRKFESVFPPPHGVRFSDVLGYYVWVGGIDHLTKCRGQQEKLEVWQHCQQEIDDLKSKLAISEAMYQSGCHAEEQRDELLAALKNARAFIYGKPSAELPCGWEIDIDKAIAKASQQ